MSGANLEGVFDPSQYEPTMGGGQALPVSPPEGHLVTIVESQMKQTQSGTGTMLVLTCRIMDGQMAGVEGNWLLNLGNPNPTTVRIAQQELACVCHAVGHLGALQNTEPLHNKPFRIVVVAQKNADGTPNENGYVNVTKVLRADGSKLTDPPGGGVAPAPATAPSQPAAPAPPAAQPPQPAAPAAPQPGWPAQPAAAAPPAAVAPASPAAPAPATAPGGQPWNQAQ